MGVFELVVSEEDTKTISIHREAWRDGEHVVVRTKTTQEDEQWVTSQLLKRMTSRRQQLPTALQLAIADCLWLQRLICSWTLTKDGAIFPLNAESIAALPFEDRDFLMRQIFQRQPEKPMRLGFKRFKTARDFQSAVETRKERFSRVQ